MKLSLIKVVTSKNVLKHFLAISLILIAIVACSEDGVDFQETGTITGTVLSEMDQSPIANAEVSTNPSSSTVFTNSDGEFSINNVNVDSYAVQAEASGFDVGFEAVTVTPDNISTVAFQLEPSEENNDAPSKPELIFPINGADDVDVQVELRWESIDPEDDELVYQISLSNGTTSEIEEFEVISDSILLVTGLNLSTTYFWQVQVSDNINVPVSSDISQFTTLESPANPILLVKKIGNNNVIFSGNGQEGDVDLNLLQLTNESENSFSPKKNSAINRIAFLRTVSGITQLFTMDLAGENIQQLTTSIPVQGFRQDQLQYSWLNNGAQLIYPNFDKLVMINNDGSGSTIVYETVDGSFISEVTIPDFDSDLAIIKTNDIEGYSVRIIAVRLSTGIEEAVILEGQSGAAGHIDVTASGNEVLYFRDISGSENSIYRIFSGRLFIYDIVNDVTTAFTTDVNSGQNNLFGKFWPTEGGLIFTSGGNNVNATTDVFIRSFDGTDVNDQLIFTSATMPDWD